VAEGRPQCGDPYAWSEGSEGVSRNSRLAALQGALCGGWCGYYRATAVTTPCHHTLDGSPCATCSTDPHHERCTRAHGQYHRRQVALLIPTPSAGGGRALGAERRRCAAVQAEMVMAVSEARPGSSSWDRVKAGTGSCRRVSS